MAKTLTAIFDLVDRFSDKMDAIASSGDEMVAKFEQAETAADEAFDTAENGSRRAAQSVDGVAEAAEQMEDSMDGASRATRSAADSAEQFGDSAESTGERAGNAFETLSNTIVATAIAKGLSEIAEKMMEASDAAASFETAAAKVSTIADPTVKSLSEMKGEITTLSMETGKSVEELSEATYSALSAGVDTANAVEFAGTATMLATGGFTTASTAVDVLTTTLNAYQLEATQAGNVSNMLITTQNLGKTTVDELASSMGKVIPLASAYGVEMDNLSTAYAVMTANGIATAESTTYIKSMLGELGSSSSQVAKVLQDETGMSFAELTASGKSLGDVLEIIGDSVGGDSTAFNELWSSAEAGIGALSLLNSGSERYNEVLNEMQKSAGATEAAYSAMTDTTEHSSERLENSMNNLNIAIGEGINPTISDMRNGLATVVDGVASFLSQHPAVVKAVTAIGVGVAAVSVGIAGVTFVTTVAIPAITAFGVALNTALGPIGWVALAVTGVTAAVAALVALFQKEETEYDTWTASTKAQYDALQDLNAEYETACETYGETSEEALRLKYQVDDATAAFEAAKMTVEEFTAQCDALEDAHAELAKSFEESNANIRAEEVGSLALIQKLEDLAGQTERTTAQQMQMESIVDTLNEQYPDLALSIDDVTEANEALFQSLKKNAQQQAEQERYQESYDTYVDLLKEQVELEDQIAAAEENIRLEQERMDNMSGWDHFWTGGEWDDLEAYQAELEELNAAYADNLAMQQDCEDAMAEYADSVDAASEATVSYEDAVSTAISSVQEEMDELCAAYDEAYESARSSIDGQIGLFDTMKTETELSISDMESAFSSQIEYLTTYTENLRKAAEYGLDEGLIASLSDGSEESAGYINAIIENIESLGSSSEEAQQFVNDFNASFEEVEAAKDEFATTVATMETDFDEKMAEIEGRLDTAIDEMNMEGDAAAAAKATMEAYTQSIRDETANAVSAAQAAANAVAAALDTSYTGRTGTTVAGHAAGTTDAEDVFVAGEDGPELIVGAGGSTVFPADETQKIINAVSGQQEERGGYAPPEFFQAREDSGTGRNGGERKVVLEIAGKGSLHLTGGGADKETMLAFLYEYLKPVLSEILTQEIFEEGDMSYEY